MNTKIEKKLFFICACMAFVLTACANSSNVEIIEQKIEVTEEIKMESTQVIEETTIVESTTKEVVMEEISIDGEEDVEEEIMSGKYMIIKLKTNPTTGFDFVVSLTNDSQGEVRLEEKFNEDPNAGVKLRITGAPIYRTYVFSAEGCPAGSATIDFNYKRNWEGGENAFHIYYDVEVDDNNNITYIGKRAQKETIDVDVEEYDDPEFTDEYEITDKNYEEEPEK